MAAADSVPRNRMGDTERRISDLEARLRELRAITSAITAVGFSASAPLSNVSVSPAGRAIPPVSVVAVVPPGMSRMTASCGCAVSAVNGTTTGDAINVAIRLRTATASTGPTQSQLITVGEQGQVSAFRGDTLTGLTPGDAITYEGLVWTDTGTWPPNQRSAIDLQVSLTWFA